MMNGRVSSFRITQFQIFLQLKNDGDVTRGSLLYLEICLLTTGRVELMLAH